MSKAAPNSSNRSKPAPEHEVRHGQVVATVFRRQTNSGFSYLDFTLSRCWRSQNSAKEQNGAGFFAENESDLIEAIRQASAWIRQANAPKRADDEPLLPAANNTDE